MKIKKEITKSQCMLLRAIDKKGLLFWLVSSFLLTFIFTFIFQWEMFLSLLAGLNISTFLIMLIDKIQATQAGRRLSERSLYLMTFFGGSIGMICAMYVLRHKSRKESFQLIIWLLVLIQFLVLLFLYSPSILSF